MLPGFTADTLLETRAYDALDSAPRWSAGRGAAPRRGAYAQELMIRSPNGSGGGDEGRLSWSHDPPVVCACPCCMTHSCGFLGLSTCLTCC
jgi:hypothetical protein